MPPYPPQPEKYDPNPRNPSGGLLGMAGQIIQNEAPAVRETEVSLAFTEMEVVTKNLCEFLRALESKLEPVLGSTKPEEAVKPQRPYASPLAGRMASLAATVDSVNTGLASILNRLEL